MRIHSHAMMLLLLSSGTLCIGLARAAETPVSTYFTAVSDDAFVRKVELPEGIAIRGSRGQDSVNGVLLVRAPAPDSTAPLTLPLLFRLREPVDDACHERLSYRASEWYGSTFWTGPDWTRVGKDWHHPGENTPSVRLFRAPRDGRVTVTGFVRKLHLDGDGIRASIHLNDQQIWQAEIEGKDDKGVDPNLSITLHRDDRLRFRVHKRGQIFCDTTFWDPLVAYEDGARFQASASFDAKRQGEGNWYYEQWVEKRPAPPAPTVVSFDRSIARRSFQMTPKRSVTRSSEEAIPLLVISDGNDTSGVILVADAAQPWTWTASMDDAGSLRLSLEASRSADSPPSTEDVPRLFLASYEGPWIACIPLLEQLDRRGATIAEVPQGSSPGDRLFANYDQLAGSMKHAPELGLFLMVQKEWEKEDGLDGSVERLRETLDRHLASTAAMLDTEQLPALRAIEQAIQSDSTSLSELYSHHLHLRMLKRDGMLSNSDYHCDELLFCKRRQPGYSHLVGQYYGWRQRPGGGILVLKDPGVSLACRDLLPSSLPPGSVLEPCLSHDGQRVVFSYVQCPEAQLAPEQLTVNEEGQDIGYFHIYEINTDGSGLRQLTSGTYDDMMPAYLPDGGIVFTSTRRRSYSRCFGPQFSNRWDSYTLHRMDRNGNHLRMLSMNDVSEWFPSVANSGHLLFARWDYIDRDAVTHQNLWSMRPDGTNPQAVWGNASPKPHCTFQAKSVPGSQKIVFIASAHHSVTAGPVCLADPTVDANSQDAITRITSGAFPESESRQIPEYYCSPWPLSEDLFLVSYSRDRLRFEGEHMRDPNPDNALGIYLIDANGNRELLYRDPTIGSTNPIPLVARPVPPVLTDLVADSDDSLGEMIVTDVYQGLDGVPRGTIKELRIVQIFPKTTPLANTPRIGLAGEENGRAILGTVPVAADGSARFLLPAQKPVLFQALDEDGLAYQTMRSTTYVQPGERTACVGCHEHRMSSPPPIERVPLALRHPPSRIDPGEFGGRPFSYTEVVQPVLDRHCVRCHGTEKKEGEVDLTGAPRNGFSVSYWSLCGVDADWRRRVGNLEATHNDLVPRYWMRNQIQQTTPGGKIGALGSRLIKMLCEGHEDVQLEEADLRRLATWIDMNAIFYGVYEPDLQARQLQGQLVDMPEIQ